ncbi:YcaO-like family protein [Streptomyces sp. A3M-1-3]|uniref:YcaO-like family protein n=1 Tax=Streptomyces sp. A3M-1-3 TaxID=2962044 RepID=UPI0020B871D0|nr:YcaO-like family protein [Streptomyces sp. A3M-1-3]MCP3817584.1 YcaO-like family protein [Streptomyces sp. A3M-1-3]
METVPSCISYSAHLSTHAELAPAAVDTVTGGAALGDHEQARRAAIGEAVERYCGNVVPDTLPTASYAQLSRAGHTGVDPREFALYSSAQYAQRGFPFVAMTPDLPISWATGRDLRDDNEILVPASLTYVNYFRGARRAEPPTNYPVLAGTAAGTSQEQAQLAALREVLERDAVTLWWLSGAPAGLLPLELSGPLATALGEATASGLRVTFLRIPSTFDITVAGVFIEDLERHLVAFGSACRSTPEASAVKAFTEAIGMHETGLELLDHDSGFWSAVRAGRIDHRPYRPHREDRAYREDFRPDWRDVNDVRLHLQVYLDPRMQDTRLDRLRTPRSPHRGHQSQDSGRLATGLDDYLQVLAAQGLRAITVDLTTPEVRAAGLHVARVMVPGLSCNAPAAFSFLGGVRLYREPVARGWVPRPPTATGLVHDPLPFS